MQKMQEMIDERNKNNLLSWVFFLAINLEVSNFVVFSSHAFWHPLPNFGKGRHVYSIMLQIPMECACNQKIALEKCYIFCLPPPLSSLFHAHEELNWPSLLFKKWKLNRQYALQPDKEFKFYLSCVLLLFVVIYLTQAIMLSKYEYFD